MSWGTGNPIERMIADIESEVGYTRSMTGRKTLATGVMEAMASVPRDAFVPDNLKHMAFENGPLPIGHGQTISQPFIVALMTDLLALNPDSTVLEIGTGSGYQTAILAHLCRQVYTVEIVPELQEAAHARLLKLGFNNIESCTGDGYSGWPEHAPYDGIIVTAAAPYIPSPLIEQLRPDGRLVIPIGQPYQRQNLIVVNKDNEGNIQQQDILAVAFVPLVTRHEKPD